MASKVLSIEMGDSLTKVCEVDFQTKNPKVYSSFVLETPKGVLEDGIITFHETFIQSMQNHLADKKIKIKQVIFSISSTKIANREVTIPYVKESRIADVIKANASDYFPIELNQYQFAHNVLSIETDDKGSKQYKVLVLAAPNTLIDSYYSFASALGLEIVALDYSGNSIYNAVKTECALGTQMIIKVDENSTLLMVLKDATIVLTRTIPYGINDAINTITYSNAWGTDLTYMEAVLISRRKTLVMRSLNDQKVESSTNEEEESEIILKAKQEVTSSLSYLIGGISRVLDYYNSVNSNANIEKILLTGMGGDFSGLSKLLTNEIGSKVITLTKLEGINIEKAFKEVSFGEYISC
ncbi:MAG TPA: pilus assembly protein PilM, partial [Lachnospiraceae bacterium]|nr:pilus assembly protein PilM [Lachnospiraceae bacterium]